MIRSHGKGTRKNIVQRTGMVARGHLWAVALISGGVIPIACPLSTSGSELAAAEEASVGGLEDTTKDVSPAELIGLTEQKVTQLLGPATITESRAPANIWHYKSSQCELELVFFMEMRTGLMRTLHYDFKNSDPAAQQQACLPAIIEENSRGVPRDKWPDKNAVAESSIGNDVPSPPKATSIEKDVPPTPTESSIESAVPPTSTTQPQTSRRDAYVRRGYARHHSRWYAAQRGGWGFTLALRSYPGWSSRDAGLTTGWGAGRFGPSPYSLSGP